MSLENHDFYGISATIVADSKNEFGNRITTFVVTFPRIVLAEFNTHRLFSRNSASSRAIPTKKMFERVKENPFIPIAFQKAHTGMQGSEYFEGEELEVVQRKWLQARDVALRVAKEMNDMEITKQLVNRVLEPYLWHTVIITSSEYENYFNLRDHEAAEIHIADLAHKMRLSMEDSTPKVLKAGEYHIPFGDQMDMDRIEALMLENGNNAQDYMRKIAVARCARVSYVNPGDGKDDYLKDIALYDRLASMGHWSPFEHVARAMNYDEKSYEWLHVVDDETIEGWCRNFRGFIQLRAEVD